MTISLFYRTDVLINFEIANCNVDLFSINLDLCSIVTRAPKDGNKTFLFCKYWFNSFLMKG